MSKPICWITTGLPASGKSTWARSVDAVRFNLDDMRKMQGYVPNNPSSWSDAHEKAVKEAFVRAVRATIDSGLDVVADNTFLSPKFPRMLRDRMHGQAQFVVKSFLDVPVEECIIRDKSRADSVGETVIRKMEKSSLGARKNGWALTNQWMNLWPDVKPAEMNVYNPLAVVCDLDGTLALHVARGPYDVAKLETDALNESVARTLFNNWMQGTKVILLSGRDGGDARESTIRWLKANKVNYDKLFMRPAGDKRPDYLVKYELFKQHVEPNYWVEFTMDDRDQCVALWRQFKLSCHQVNEGAF